MTDDRLPTELWVMAHVRRCIADSIPVAVVRKGEAMGGTLLLVVNQLEHGCRVLSQTRDFDGKLGWMAAFDGALVPAAEADSYVARAIDRDPDLWVVEVEGRDGRHPFDGDVF